MLFSCQTQNVTWIKIAIKNNSRKHFGRQPEDDFNKELYRASRNKVSKMCKNKQK